MTLGKKNPSARTKRKNAHCLRHFIFFINAYSPLFFILLWFFYWDSLNQDTFSLPMIWAYLLIGAVIIILIIAFLALLYILHDMHNLTKETYVPIRRKNITGEALTYIIPYLVAIIGFHEFTIITVLPLLIVLVLLYVIYIRSDLMSLNPVLMIIGYHTFSVDIDEYHSIFVITRERKIPLNNKKLNMYELTERIYFWEPEQT